MNLFRELYTVYDVLADQSGPVFEAPNRDVAERIFLGLIQENPKVPADQINLVYMGKFVQPYKIVTPEFEENYMISGADLIVKSQKAAQSEKEK